MQSSILCVKFAAQTQPGGDFHNANTTLSALTFPSAKYLYPSVKTFSKPPSSFFTGAGLTFPSLTTPGTFRKNPASSRLSSLFKP